MYELRAETCSQPTYKEWKERVKREAEEKVGGFPAYLQGMERLCYVKNPFLFTQFPAYLQGMER